MKKLTCSFVLLLLLCTSYAQKKFHLVKFEKIRPAFHADFNCAEVIDNRLIRHNIGFAQKNINNRVVPARFKEDFAPYLKKHINKFFHKAANPRPLVFIIHELTISERTSAFTEHGKCILKMEFAEYRNDELYSLGTFSKTLIKGGIDVTKKHDDRIEACLAACIGEFMKSDWKNKEAKLVELNQTKAPLDFANIPKAGAYGSYNQLLRGETLDLDYQLERYNPASKEERYRIRGLDKKDRRKILYLSDGENIYLHASRYSYNSHFIKAKHFGKYTYFEDQFSDKNDTATLGFLGAALSNTGRGIILNTQKNLVYSLTNARLVQLLKNHPEILKTYKDSDKRRVDRELAILELNKKLK